MPVSEKMTELERELLENMDGRRTHHADGSAIKWGAWMSACLEGLKGRGYVTRTGTRYEITPVGRAKLEGDRHDRT
jgi:hypothetical protein